MTHTALVGRRIACLRQASGATIAARLGDPDPQQPKEKAPLILMTLAGTLLGFRLFVGAIIGVRLLALRWKTIVQGS
jgi:hypothetical protein